MSFDNDTLTHDQAQSLSTLTRERHSKQIFYGWWVVLRQQLHSSGEYLSPYIPSACSLSRLCRSSTPVAPPCL